MRTTCEQEETAGTGGGVATEGVSEPAPAPKRGRGRPKKKGTVRKQTIELKRLKSYDRLSSGGDESSGSDSSSSSSSSGSDSDTSENDGSGGEMGGRGGGRISTSSNGGEKGQRKRQRAKKHDEQYSNTNSGKLVQHQSGGGPEKGVGVVKKVKGWKPFACPMSGCEKRYVVKR